MPAKLAGMPLCLHGMRDHGRHRPTLECGVIAGLCGRAGEKKWTAALHAAALDDRSADVLATDLDHYLPRHLPGFLSDLPFDAEQGADALHRPVELHLPDVARHVLDGRRAIDDFRAVRGIF